MQQPIQTPATITPIYREIRPQQEAALQEKDTVVAESHVSPADQMRRIEREEEPERWDGLS